MGNAIFGAIYHKLLEKSKKMAKWPIPKKMRRVKQIK